MAQFQIRSIRRQDYDQWTTLWRAYLAFYGTTLPAARFPEAFDTLFDEDPGSFEGLVAASGDDLLGLVHFVYHPHMWRAEGVCYLLDLYTRPDTRGKGVARALIEAVYHAADLRGVPTVYWNTQEFNYLGRMLYDQVAEKTPFIKYQRTSA